MHKKTDSERGVFPVPKIDLPPELARQNSVRNTLLAFAAALAYGVSAAPGFAAGRELLQILIQKAAAPLIVNAANAGGYADLAAIGSVGVMTLVWLATLLLVWHRAERAESGPARLRLTGKWMLGALLFFACASGLVWILTGSPPRLTGG